MYAVLSGNRAVLLGEHRILSSKLRGARPAPSLPVVFPGRATLEGFPNGPLLPYETASSWDIAGFRIVGLDPGFRRTASLTTRPGVSEAVYRIGDESSEKLIVLLGDSHSFTWARKVRSTGRGFAGRPA